MKNLKFIGFVVLVLLFQNCKNNKETENDRSTKDSIPEQKEITTPPIKDSIKTIDSLENTPEVLPEIEKKDKKNQIKKAETTSKVVLKTTPETPETPKTLNQSTADKPKEEPQIIEDKVQEVKEVIKKEDPKPIIVKTPVDDSNWVVPVKYKDMKNPIAAKTDAAIGKSLYTKHCKSCHGTEGYGDGAKADGLKGDLGDFSTSKFQAQTDGSLFYKTTFGREDMPEFSKKLPSDEDRWLIINYLRTLAQ